MKKTFTLFFLVVLLATGCGRDVASSDVVDEATMASLLTDIYLAEGYEAIVGDYQYEQRKTEIVGLYDSIFSKHGVTPEQFEASHEYYIAHRQRYKAICDHVLDTLNAMQKSDN